MLVLVARNTGLSQMALARALGIDRSTLVPILEIGCKRAAFSIRRRSPTGRAYCMR